MLTETDQAPDTAAHSRAKSTDGAWTHRNSFMMSEIAAILAARSTKLPDQHFSTPLDIA